MEARRPGVWVVVPVYNGGAYLAECLESVRAQTYADWRMLVADNASTDETSRVAASFAACDPRIEVRRFDEHLSVIRNWNRTVALLPEDAAYCKFALADDRLYPDCLERMVDLAERHPSVGMVAAYVDVFGRVSTDGPPADVVSGRAAARHHLLGGRYYFGSPNSLLFRADLVRARALHFFDELADAATPDWVFFQADTDVCYSLLAHSDFGFVHEPLTYTRLHDASITSRWTKGVGTWLPGHLLTVLRHGPVFLSDDELAVRVTEILRRYEAFLARNVVKGRVFRDPRFRAYQAGALARIRPLLSGRIADRAVLALIAATVVA